MGKMQAQPVYSTDTSFEKIWAILDRTAKWQEESAKWQEESAKRQEEIDRLFKETDRKMQETALQQKETDRIIKETQKETDRQMKDFNKRFGDLTKRFGEVVEYMIAPNLREKFKELGLIFPQACSNKDVSDFENDLFFEIDVMLENGDKAMLVEVKTKLTTEYVKEHIKRLEKMRMYADLHGDKRAFLGAVAGVVVTSNVKKYALIQGFFVIEPSGETFHITPPNNKPKEW